MTDTNYEVHYYEDEDPEDIEFFDNLPKQRNSLKSTGAKISLTQPLFTE